MTKKITLTICMNVRLSPRSLKENQSLLRIREGFSLRQLSISHETVVRNTYFDTDT